MFDGHGGTDSSIYVKENIQDIVQNSSYWRTYTTSGRSVVNHLVEMFLDVYKELDFRLRSNQSQSLGQDCSGTTAVCALITPNYIVCANVGDSRCVIAFQGDKSRPLTFDHKPEVAEERRRIEAAGGLVTNGRIDNNISVSRSLGDFQFKNDHSLPPDQQKVSLFTHFEFECVHRGARGMLSSKTPILYL